MKTTMLMRPIANPRRTTLMDVADVSPQAARGRTAADVSPESPEQPPARERPLPQRTANPRRTVLMELPAVAAADDNVTGEVPDVIHVSAGTAV